MEEHTTGPTTDEAPHTGPRVSADDVRDIGRLRRTRNEKYVAGVAGGLARHLDIDPVILRVAFVVLSFFGGAGVIAYAAFWAFVPEDGTDDAPVRLDQRSRGIALVAVLALAVLAVLGDVFGDGPGGWFAWPLLLVAVVAWLVVSRRDRRREAGARPGGYGPQGTPGGYGFPAGPASPATDPGTGGTAYAGPPHPAQPGYVQPPVLRPDVPRDPRKRGPILFWFTLALAALSVGVLGIADAAGAPVTDSAYPALVLGVVALMLLVGAFVGRAGGLILVGCVTALVLSVSTVADRYDGGQVRATPTAASQVKDRYDTFAGEVVIDLTEVTDLENLDGRTVEIDLGAGRVQVVVPRDIDVEVTGHVGAGGALNLFDQHHDGWGFSAAGLHDGGEDVPTLTLDIDLLLGEAEVVAR